MKRQGENGYPQIKEFLKPPETRREAGGRAFLRTIRMCTHFYTQDGARKMVAIFLAKLKVLQKYIQRKCSEILYRLNIASLFYLWRRVLVKLATRLID